MSPSLCVADDREGRVLSSTDPGDGAAASWSIEHVPRALFLTALSCPSAALCVALNESAALFSSSDPSRGAAAKWSVEHVDRLSGLHGVSCVSPSLCVAVDGRGNAVIATAATHKHA